MKKATFSLVATLLCYCAFAQQPVHWTYSTKKLNATTYELHLTANIDEGWHIYSQKQPDDAIAFPTKIKLNENPLVRADVPVTEIGQLQKKTIEALGIQQYQYSNKVDFVQRIELKHRVKAQITGSITFQVCTEQLCLPAKEEVFSLVL